jgi:hypothetical protein
MVDKSRQKTFVSLIDCGTQGNEKEFLEWHASLYGYNQREVNKKGVLSLYKNLESNGTVTRTKYFVIYEPDSSLNNNVLTDPEPFGEKAKTYSGNWDVVLNAQYEKIKPTHKTNTSDKPVRGILAVLTNRRIDVTDKAFNHWYSNTHVPELVGTGLFQRTSRYKLLRSDQDAPEYAAIYETDLDPKEAADGLLKYKGMWTKDPTYGTVYEVWLRASFQTI